MSMEHGFWGTLIMSSTTDGWVSWLYLTLSFGCLIYNLLNLNEY